MCRWPFFGNVRVVLVDDHHVVRRGLRSFLDSFDDISVIGEAANGEELLAKVKTWLPDVVLMDLLMPGGMTERETDVLRRLAHGRTNRAIAEALVISEETVKSHVGNILAKLHLAHRTQAALYALKQGLVGLDELEV